MAEMDDMGETLRRHADPVLYVHDRRRERPRRPAGKRTEVARHVRLVVVAASALNYTMII